MALQEREQDSLLQVRFSSFTQNHPAAVTHFISFSHLLSEICLSLWFFFLKFSCFFLPHSLLLIFLSMPAQHCSEKLNKCCSHDDVPSTLLLLLHQHKRHDVALPYSIVFCCFPFFVVCLFLEKAPWFVIIIFNVPFFAGAVYFLWILSEKSKDCGIREKCYFSSALWWFETLKKQAVEADFDLFARFMQVVKEQRWRRLCKIETWLMLLRFARRRFS